MNTVTLPFGPWTPDAPELAAGSTEAKNVVPGEANSYRPLYALTAVAPTGLILRCQGARAFFTADGTVRIYAGDREHLYRRAADSFSDASGGVAFNCPADDYWSFEQWEDQVVAVNLGDAPQYANMETGDFAPLGYTEDENEPQPPRARYVLHDRQPRHLILGNLFDDTEGAQPRTVRWSGALDIHRWGDQERYQSGAQEMPEKGGWVQALVGAPYPTVFQERMIRRMSYVGGNIVYGFDTIEDGIGAMLGGNAVVQWGALTFFWSEDGAYIWDGSAASPIGTSQVDRWFRSNLDYKMRRLACGAFDPVNRLVMWAIPTTFSGTSYTAPSTLVMFSLREKRWSWGEQALEFLLSVPDRGYSLEDLDQFGSVETLLWSLDSRVWRGGSLAFGAFDTEHKLATFTGPAMAATIETAEKQAAAGSLMFANQARPLVDESSGTVSVALGMRAQNVGDALTYGTATARNVAGFCPVRASGRYGRARVTIAAGAEWTHAQGVELTMRAAGKR